MTEFVPVSHWAWSQMKGEDPLCTGTLREILDGSDANCIAVECDSCVFQVGIARPRGRVLSGSQPATGPDSRIESSASHEFEAGF